MTVYNYNKKNKFCTNYLKTLKLNFTKKHDAAINISISSNVVEIFLANQNPSLIILGWGYP